MTSLTEEKQELTLLNTVDLGPSDEFMSLAGKCFETKASQFTYKACFFKKASQKDGSGLHTDLGSWKGFEAHYKKAVFDGGDHCYDAPQRSMSLELHCGVSEVAWDGAEPEKCVYSMKLTTPAACTADEAAALRSKLVELEQLEKEIAEGLGITHDEL